MQHHQIRSQYVEVQRRITNISSHVCYFHNKYDDMVCSHTMISGEKHFLEDRSCPHASTHRKHHTHNVCTTINTQNTREGYAFARRAIITLFTHTFSLESCHSALNTISPIQYIRYDGSSRPFCFAYNVSNMT